ncbi:hypothetical protein CFIO01_08201 [Colletotrichum fioriniae PJ7]|uniref:Uncharacterized protein n=1 Tax=Colletotrichum fioriniae PJ7 TaxID=1445577 RepID=A0A010QWX5_9PEZI|nr:hypothetical protein CFIO01_08201 [Colletotrichum fioriniae PJ7]
MQAHLALAAFLKSQVSRARLPGLSGGRGRYYSMWIPPLTSAAIDSTQQVLPSSKRHIFFPFFLTSDQLSGDKRPGHTDSKLDNGRKAPQNHHRFMLRQTASTTLALLDGWMDGGMGGFAGWARATPKIQATKNKSGGETNSLSLEENDESTTILANLRLTRRRYGNAEMRLRTGFHARSKRPRRVQPIEHRRLIEGKKVFAPRRPVSFVRRFETVEKLRHGSCLSTLPEPIAQPRVPDICLSDNGNGALGALDTSSQLYFRDMATASSRRPNLDTSVGIIRARNGTPPSCAQSVPLGHATLDVMRWLQERSP